MDGEPGVEKRTKYFATWIVLFLIVVTWGAAAFGVIESVDRRLGIWARWAMAAFALLLLLCLAGREINGHWLGALIDPRNKMSLSRLQITLWTVMVLSAYLTIAFHRLRAQGPTTALEVAFPEELILAMGISSASFAGSSLIKSNKKNKNVRIDARLSPDAADKRVTAAKDDLEKAKSELDKLIQDEAQLKVDLEKEKDPSLKENLTTRLESCAVNKPATAAKQIEKERALKQAQDELASIQKAQGLLHKNDDPKDARWSDLFRGEEIANYKLLDIAKVQMLFFTLVVVVVYGAAIARLLHDPDELAKAEIAFPPFSKSLNALLGISHATYLSVKTVDHE